MPSQASRNLVPVTGEIRAVVGRNGWCLFFGLAEKVLSPDYPLRAQLLEDEGDPGFRKGSVKEAVMRYEEPLNGTQLSDRKREEIALKLFAVAGAQLRLVD